MLTAKMTQLITNHRAGMVATVRDDGLPAVSPKATFVVVSEREIAYGDIRSPGTRSNISSRPAVEVCFIDILSRVALRVRGTAAAVAKDTASSALTLAMQRDWAEYIPHMSCYVTIAISEARLVTSPAYDLGYTHAQLQSANLAKLKALAAPD